MICPAKSGSNWGVGRGLCAKTTVVIAVRVAKASDERNEKKRMLLFLLVLVYDILEVGVWSVLGRCLQTRFKSSQPSIEALILALLS